MSSRSSAMRPRSSRKEAWRTGRPFCNAREVSCNTRGGSRNALEASRNTREGSRNTGEDSRSAAEGLCSTRGGNCNAEEGFRSTRKDSCSAEKALRNAREPSRSAAGGNRALQPGFSASQEDSPVLQTVSARSCCSFSALQKGCSCCREGVAARQEVFVQGAKPTGASRILSPAAPDGSSARQSVSAASRGAVAGAAGEGFMPPFVGCLCRNTVGYRP